MSSRKEVHSSDYDETSSCSTDSFDNGDCHHVPLHQHTSPNDRTKCPSFSARHSNLHHNMVTMAEMEAIRSMSGIRGRTGSSSSLVMAVNESECLPSPSTLASGNGYSQRRRWMRRSSRPLLEPPRQQAQRQQRQRRQHRKQRLSTISILLTLLLTLLPTLLQTSTHQVHASSSGGYLTLPPSRNYSAFQSSSILPSSLRPLSSLPEREPTPHNLNAGEMCGTVDGKERDYNLPMSRMDTLLPLNVVGIYAAGGEIVVSVNLFGGGGGGGGHFEFSACPVVYPNAPTEDCFERFPLEFVRDEYYGAVKDENYPSRAYIPYGSAFQNGLLEPVESVGAGPGGATMMEFSYTLKLPTNEEAEELNTDLGVLESEGVPNGNVDGRTYTTTMASTTQKRHNGGRALQQQPQPQWIATQSGNIIVPSQIETVLISSLSTDGEGTTTIITLNGDVTIIEGGPKIPASSTLTYGSKEIYGVGISEELLPGEVELPVNGPGGKETGTFEEETTGAGDFIRPPPRPEDGSTGDVVPSNSAASAFASGGGGGSSSSGDLSNTAAISSPLTTNAANTVASNPNQKYVLLRWHYTTARDCHPPGYDEYPWPSNWGEWMPQWGGECKGGNGNQEEYWNCAEILILGPSGAAEGVDDAIPEATSDINVLPVDIPEPPLEPQAKPIPADNISIPADQNTIHAVDDRTITTGTLPVKIDVLQNDIGDPLIVTSTRNGRHGTCVVTDDNQVQYNATVGFEGLDRCAYTVCLGDWPTKKDGEKVWKEGENVCDEGWIYILNTASTGSDDVNSQTQSTMIPQLLANSGTIVAVDDGIVTNVDEPIWIDVAANDEYTADDPTGGGVAPQFVMEITTNALYGTCQVVFASSNYPNTTPNDNRQEVLYTPTVGFEGWDHCTYKICLPGGLAGSSNVVNDGGEEEDVCDEARVKIKVFPGAIVAESKPIILSDTPRPTPMPAAMAPVEEEEVDLNLTVFTPNSDPIASPDTVTVVEGEEAFIEVLANDQDPDGDDLAIYSWTSPQSGGSVEEVESSILRYTPADGFVGTDAFEYTVCDSSDRCDTASVSVKVIPRVFAVDDEVTTATSTPIVVDVTANDESSSKKPLVVTDVNRAKHGKCEVVGNKVRYTPTAGFVGSDRCAYQVCSREEEGGQCDKGRVDVRVLPSPIFEKPQRPTEQQTVDTSEVEVESNEPAVQTTANKPYKPAEQTAEQSEQTPEAEPEGPTSGTTEQTSETTDEDLETVYAEDEVVVTSLNTPIIVDVTSNDFVKGMGELILSRVGGATNGSCKITKDNQLRYVPKKGFVGQDHCGYVVCRNSVCDEGILRIKVTSREAASKEPLQQKQESSNSGVGGGDEGLVSNHESSGGLSLESTHSQRARTGSAGLSAAAIHCQDKNGKGRKLLRGGVLGRRRRKLPKNAFCVGSSLVTTTPATTAAGDDEITYTSTYHKKEDRSSASSALYTPRMSALRFGRTASSSLSDNDESGSSSYIETVITIPASGDAVIMPGFPDKCFGSVPSMLISSAASSAGRHETLLQFQTSAVDRSICNAGGVVSANVHLYSLVNSHQSGIFVTTSNNTWSENSVSWNNAPKSDGIVLRSDNHLHSIEVNKWYGVDVSSALILGETLSIRILSNEGERSVAQYASRDHPDGLLKPILNVTCVSLDVFGDGHDMDQ